MSVSIRQIILYGLIFIIGTGGAIVVNQYNTKRSAEAERMMLPDLITFGIDSSERMARRYTLVIYLHPDCDYCQSEISDLAANQEILKIVEVILISTGDQPSTEDLLANNNLVVGRDVLVGYDKDDRFYELFATRSVPASFV